jgi:hypothetical protein
MTLTAADLDLIGRARELADADGPGDFRRILGKPHDLEQAALYADALGTAQYLLAELAGLAERLAGGR